MLDKNDLKMIKRNMTSGVSIDKYINKLRANEALDTIFNINNQMRTVLMYYVENGDCQKVVSLLQGENPPATNILDHQKQNALALAVTQACTKENYPLKIIEELLDHSPENQLFQADIDGEIPLHLALRNGNIPVVEVLLKFFAEKQLLTKSVPQGDTAFVFAARSRNNKLIVFLVKKYPYILNQRTTDGFTPLHCAVKFDNFHLVWFLLQKGSEGQELIGDDVNTLPIAVVCTDCDSKIFEELLKKNVEKQLTHRDKVGNTFMFNPLMLTTQKLFEILVKAARREEIDLKTLFKQKNLAGLSPIHLVVSFQESESTINILQQILSICGEEQLMLTGPGGETPLLMAAQFGNVKIVQTLTQYEKPEQFLTQNHSGIIPLTAAIMDGFTEAQRPLSENAKKIINILLQKYPDRQLQCRYKGCNIFNFIVTFRKSLEVLEMLLTYVTEEQLVKDDTEVGFVALNSAVAMGDERYVRAFMKLKFVSKIINIQDNASGATPLHTAVKENNYAIVSMLIDNGADINITSRQGFTSVHVACITGNIKILSLLLEHKGELYALTHAGLSVLDLAIGSRDLSTVEALLTKHKFKLTVSGLHRTSIFSILKQNADMAQLLLEHDINLNVTHTVGDFYYSLVFLAVQLLKFELLEVLKKFGQGVDGEISQGVTLADYIVVKYKNKKFIYDKLKKIFPELPDLNTAEEKIGSVTIQEQQAYPEQSKPLKPREYLLSLGFSAADLAELEKERKERKSTMKLITRVWSLEEHKPAKIVYFLNGKINSTHKSLIPIEGAGAENHYCYLDIQSLQAQGCDLDELNAVRLKFDGQHIKKLDDDLGKHYDLIKLSPEVDPVQKQYSHELKVNKMDRILMIQEGGLLIGIKYIPGGLHKQADTQALRASARSNAHLEIQWPEDIVFADAQVDKLKYDA